MPASQAVIVLKMRLNPADLYAPAGETPEATVANVKQKLISMLQAYRRAAGDPGWGRVPLSVRVILLDSTGRVTEQGR